MSQQEQSEIQEVFHFYDVKGDNRITVSQVGVALRSLGQFPTEAQIDTLAQAWTDKESRITVEEFTPLLHNIQKNAEKAATQEEFVECLTHFDRDRSGFVGIIELRHMLENSGEKMDATDVDLIVRGMLDDNGKININEFVQMIMS